MSYDPAFQEEPTNTEQENEEQKYRKLWRLENGIWPATTLTFIVLSTVCSALLWLKQNWVGELLYSSGGEIWADYKWIGLLGSTLLHINAIHLVFNCYWIWLLGRVVESEMGWKRYLFFFFVAAWTCATAQLALSGQPGVGLSGVVYALFGYMLVNRRKVKAYAYAVPKRTIALLVIWLFACIVLNYTDVIAIANGAHFAGLVVGCLVGFAGHRSPRHEALVGALALVVLSIPLVWAPWQEDWLMVRIEKNTAQWDDATRLKNLDRVLALNPKNPWAHMYKGMIYSATKQYTQSREEFLASILNKPDYAISYNDLAWLLCTCPDQALRNGKAALNYAHTACDLTHWQEAAYLDTYAAAFAECGDFETAVKWIREARELDPANRSEYEAHLANFLAGQPWREK